MNWSKWLVGCGVLAVCSIARADIKYTQVTTMGDDSAAASAGTSHALHAVRDGAERIEMTMKIGGAEIKNVSIRYCEPGKTVRLNSGLKIYTEDFPQSSEPEKTVAGKPDKDASTQADGTGKIVTTYSVQDLGVETVADWKARHYKVGMKMEMSGCIGNSNMNMDFEYWVADVKDAVPCKKMAMPAMPNMGPRKTDCRLTYETKGDVAAYAKAMNGLIVKSKNFMDGKLISTTEVTSLSQAKLGDELFTVPADYKKVTSAEFDKAQQQAMMKAIMGGRMQDSDNTGDDDN